MQRYLKILLFGWVVVLVSLTGVNWLIDPYRIFHAPWVRQNYYPLDHGLRITTSGIINTESFDAMILGTSMAQNFSAQQASELFGYRFVNLSLSGAPLVERSQILRYALARKPLRHVIMSLDRLGEEDFEHTQLAPYAFLYDDRSFNDLWLYASELKATRFIFCQNNLLPVNLRCQDVREDLETLVSWKNNQGHAGRFGGLEKWLGKENDVQTKVALKEIVSTIEAIESGKVGSFDALLVTETAVRQARRVEEIIIQAGRYPATRFDLFFPPFSRLNYALRKQGDPGSFQQYLETIDLTVKMAAQYPNVRIFGFETEDFLDDLANYKDTQHYHHRHNAEMLQWMKDGTRQLAMVNLDAYNRAISDRAARFPLRKIGMQIGSYLSGG